MTAERATPATAKAGANAIAGEGAVTRRGVPSARAAWLLAARPKTLPAAVAPVLVGTAVAIAEDGFVPLAALAALAVALLLQIAANLANDVFDFRRGADTAARLGPTRVTQSGLIAPGLVLAATAVVLAAAALCGLYLIGRGGWPIALLGLLALVSAVAYTGGPAPLGYLGLGDVFVFGFFGLVAVAGTAFVQTGRLSPLALAAAVPVGCLATAILVVNNLRDAITDRAAGKRTLAVRLGAARTRWEFASLVGVAYVAMPVGWTAGTFSGWWWLPWLSAPLAVSLVARLWTTHGAALNPLLGATARLELVFAVLLTGSIVL
ncbi:MAG: 1,4-dihydroxy-2-naphthoate polyprenyltransferase [uncultured Thermomicrobiales bacterium]|uniref:1,4-dihydroxy-2-naphthoate octaprenyltransferase n=1 Tax=uncultured Thermomicrobiales bacterium TaxID=1645740 RepID=A0A6J4U7J7_9BACT|nr:MAG: 1,4-dihydroxy-2-naphthoate polyprenyltransferase [uncultured Thermomicrobiales bacterium]